MKSLNAVGLRFDLLGAPAMTARNKDSLFIRIFGVVVLGAVWIMAFPEYYRVSLNVWSGIQGISVSTFRMVYFVLAVNPLATFCAFALFAAFAVWLRRQKDEWF